MEIDSLLISRTAVEPLICAQSLHSKHVAKVILASTVGIHVVIIIFVTHHVAHRSLSATRLFSWWRVKVERLLLLRVRSRRVAPANSSFAMIMPLGRMLVGFEIDWRLNMGKSSSLVHRVVDVRLLEQHVGRVIKAVSVGQTHAWVRVEVWTAGRIMVVWPVVIA